MAIGVRGVVDQTLKKLGRTVLRDLNRPITDLDSAVPSNELPILAKGVQGSFLVRGVKNWKALGPGSSGQVLTSQGSGKDAIWR